MAHTTITRHQEDKLSKATSPLKINYAGLFDFIFHIKSHQIGHALGKK